MKKQTIIALLFCSLMNLITAERTHACSCSEKDRSGFLPRIIIGETLKLPANAKGVLYLVFGSNIQELSPENFEIRQLDSDLNVEVEIVKLKYREATYLQLYRVQPVNGFLSGKSYLFRANVKPPEIGRGSEPSRQEVTVEVSATALDPQILNSISLQTLGEIKFSLIPVSMGGSCSENVLADTQTLQYLIPKELEPYANSLLYSTRISIDTNSSEVPQQGEDDFFEWSYRSSLCSSPGIGKSEVGNLKELIVNRCRNSGEFWVKPDQAYGELAFFELTDQIYKTKTLTLTFSELGKAQCDMLPRISQLLKSGDTEKVKKLLCEEFYEMQSLRDSEPAALAALLSEVSSYAKHENAKIRACAVSIISGSRSYFDQNKDQALLYSLCQKIAIVLLETLTSESQNEARYDAMRGLGDIFMNSSPKEFPSFDIILNRLIEMAQSENDTVRDNAMELITYLQSAAKKAFPVLIKAATDMSKTNSRAPRALAAVDPKNPETIPALIIALSHPNNGHQEEAANVLGEIGASDERTILALVEALKRGNYSAAETLKTIGNGGGAKIVVPLMTEVINTANDREVIMNATEVLKGIEYTSRAME